MKAKEANEWALALLAVEADVFVDAVNCEFDSNEYISAQFTVEEAREIAAAAEKLAMKLFRKADAQKMNVILGMSKRNDLSKV